MSYAMYLGGLTLPVLPQSIEMTAPERTEIIDLMSDDQILRVHQGGLKTFFCKLFLERDASDDETEHCISYLERLYEQQLPAYLVIVRRDAEGHSLSDTKAVVLLTSYVIREDATLGLGLQLELRLTEYATTQTLLYGYGEDILQVVLTPEQGESIGTAARMYRVRAGDTLFSIAQAVWGDGSRWTELYRANEHLIQMGCMLQEGTFLNIPLT